MRKHKLYYYEKGTTSKYLAEYLDSIGMGKCFDFIEVPDFYFFGHVTPSIKTADNEWVDIPNDIVKFIKSMEEGYELIDLVPEEIVINI